LRNSEIGANRDKKILLEIERCGVLDTEQIRVLFFRHLAHGRRIAQKRLRILFDKGRVERGREYGRPCYYHMGGWKQVEHRIGVNWVYCYFMANLKSWERLEWEYEVDIGGVRPDAIARIVNTVKRTERTVCVEFDNDTGSDIRDKYLDEAVFVVTTGKVEKFKGFECLRLDDIKRGLGS
jgi:hypothetical protein